MANGGAVVAFVPLSSAAQATVSTLKWGKGESPGTAPLMNQPTAPLKNTDARIATTVRPEEGVQKLPAIAAP